MKFLEEIEEAFQYVVIGIEEFQILNVGQDIFLYTTLITKRVVREVQEKAIVRSPLHLFLLVLLTILDKTLERKFF